MRAVLPSKPSRCDPYHDLFSRMSKLRSTTPSGTSVSNSHLSIVIGLADGDRFAYGERGSHTPR